MLRKTVILTPTTDHVNYLPDYQQCHTPSQSSATDAYNASQKSQIAECQDQLKTLARKQSRPIQDHNQSMSFENHTYIAPSYAKPRQTANNQYLTSVRKLTRQHQTLHGTLIHRKAAKSHKQKASEIATIPQEQRSRKRIGETRSKGRKKALVNGETVYEARAP